MALQKKKKQKHPPNPPTHTIITFITQPLRARPIFTAICAELIWVILLSQLSTPCYLVAVAVISTLAYSLSWDAGTLLLTSS